MESDRKTISPEDVIAKLKDDGDFDRLRLQIVRKLKDNEELRSSIGSIVKQSLALNRPEADHMKPRQLSDAIYGEVGDEVKSKISDNLWEIIRSGDGMKSEITKTVESVYNKLLNPYANGEGGPSSPQNAITVQKEPEKNGFITAPGPAENGLLPENEPNEPPGFSRTNHHNNNNHVEQHRQGVPYQNEGELRPGKRKGDCLQENKLEQNSADGGDHISSALNPFDVNDDDPDLPPGFG